MKSPPDVLHYVHQAFRMSITRGDRMRGHRAFVLVKIERIDLTPYVLVTTHDGWGHDMSEAEADARANLLGSLLWTFRDDKDEPRLIGVAVPHSGMSIEADPEPRVWVKRHVLALSKPPTLNPHGGVPDAERAKRRRAQKQPGLVVDTESDLHATPEGCARPGYYVVAILVDAARQGMKWTVGAFTSDINEALETLRITVARRGADTVALIDPDGQVSHHPEAP